MAIGPAHRVAAAPAPAAPRIQSDGELLAQFVKTQDEAAFETLVRRHGPMVFRVCRRVLRDGADAEDAFQATFIVLARKASSVVKRESVSSWLYGVAYRVAVRARSRADRRLFHEQQQVARPSVGNNDELVWRDLRPALDEEVNRLPEKYRSPVVLCYFEGKTNEEAAAQLACPAGTVKVRLMRARDLLRERLTRRGLMMSAGGFGTLLAGEGTAMALPLAMVDGTMQGAVHGRLPAGVQGLVAATVQGMLLARVKQGAAIAVLLAVAAWFLPWGPGSWQRSQSLPPHKAKITSVVLSSDGRLVASIATNDQHVRVRDVTSGREWLIPTADPAAEFHNMLLAPDDSAMTIESFDYPWSTRQPNVKRRVKVVDLATGRERFVLNEADCTLHGARFSADSRELLALTNDPATQRLLLTVRDVQTGAVKRVHRGPTGVRLVTTSQSGDGRTMLLASPDWARQPGQVGARLWDMVAERELATLTETSPGLGFSAFAPDQRSLVVTEADTRVAQDDHGVVVQIWDVRGKRPAKKIVFGPPGSYITRIVFAPDGKTLALPGKIDSRATVKFYDLDSGRELTAIQGTPAEKNGFPALGFSGNGKFLALGAQDGSLSLWRWQR